MATAQIRPDWTIGTLNLTAGVVEFTTTDSLLETAAIQAGDSIITESGLVLIIADITGQNSGTLMEPCPVGAAGIGQPLRVRFQPDGSRYNGATADLVQLLGSGNVYEFSGLDGSNGGIPIFNGAGTMDVVPSGDVGIQDPNGSLGKLAALTLTANKAFTTDGSGNAQQIDLGTLGRALLALASGTSAQYVQGNGTLQAKTGLPISSATQTALDAKASLSGATFTGAITLGGGLGVNQNALIVREFGVQRWGVDFIASDGSLRFQTFISGAWTGSSVTLLPDKSVQFAGTISKGGGTFLIDHPLDPFNKNLRHGFVEAPRYDLIYRGTVQLVSGRATVDIDAASNMTSGTFAALTTNAVVTSLQNQEGFARLKPWPINGGSFEVICEDDTCTDLVSWVVIAERNDPFVKSDLDPNTDSDGRFVPEFQKDDA